MPEYLSPGVYVEEVASGPSPIEGVSTSTAGFVGGAERGPETPQLITSFVQYQRVYGGYNSNYSYLTYAVQGFFDNGGQICFVTRVVHSDEAGVKPIALIASADIDTLTFFAVGRGAWANGVFVTLGQVQGPGGTSLYSVTLQYYKVSPLTFSVNVLPFATRVSDLPPSGTSQIVIANVQGTNGGNDRLYIRIFDSSGNKVVDTDETKLPATAAIAAQVTGLRSLLGLGAPSHSQPFSSPPGTSTSFSQPTSPVITAILALAPPPPDYSEQYDGLSTIPGSSNNIITMINGASLLVRVRWTTPGVTGISLFNQPMPLTDGAGATEMLTVTDLNGTTEPILDPTVAGNISDPVYLGGSGLASLANIDDVSIVVVPDTVSDGSNVLMQDVITHCTLLKYRFAVFSFPQNVTSQIATLMPPFDTSYAAIYYPWIRVFDPSINDMILIPPSGHIAGIYANVDITRGVHKAPANEVLVDALDLQVPVPKGDQDILNPRNVNCIRDFRPAGRGIRVWGARTMSSDSNWRYINVRRLFIYVEKSIDEGTQWVVFEPNDDETWARVVRTITNFLTRVWKSGALFGTSAADAFFVKCDRTTMTQDDIDNGRLICLIGIAPVRPAEFVIFRISQYTADSSS